MERRGTEFSARQDEAETAERRKWMVRAAPGAKTDAKRLFKNMKHAHAVAIDYCKALEFFPETRPDNGQGNVLDMDFEKVKNEIFYRLRVDDDSFNGKSLRVFFWVQTGTRTIWVLGAKWRPDAYADWVKEIMRTRMKRLIGG